MLASCGAPSYSSFCPLQFSVLLLHSFSSNSLDTRRPAFCAGQDPLLQGSHRCPWISFSCPSSSFFPAIWWCSRLLSASCRQPSAWIIPWCSSYKQWSSIDSFFSPLRCSCSFWHSAIPGIVRENAHDIATEVFPYFFRIFIYLVISFHRFRLVSA